MLRLVGWGPSALGLRLVSFRVPNARKSKFVGMSRPCRWDRNLAVTFTRDARGDPAAAANADADLNAGIGRRHQLGW